ncbi:mechanosensitive ion channel [Candidatus Woesearchaeota archaeon]|jgi:small-conductance mechanosensitive channel|nr:mechanosensitive ion channel [Candidatus Woesearchaeota archaeon]MBT5740332.1 mechanosensitive ion channel [Candidatus Woesearchaeota archaeon]
MVNTTLAQGVETAQNLTANIAVGIVILFIGFAIGVLAKKFLLRIFKEIELNKWSKKLNINFNLERGVSSLISVIIYLITIILFLNHLGVTSIVLWVVIGATLLLAILTFLVGVRDLIPNLLAYFILKRKKHVKVGKVVKIREISGTVERVGYLETEIKTEQKDTLYVPNSLFLRNKLWIKR